MTARARARVTSTPGHQYTVDFPNQASDTPTHLVVRCESFVRGRLVAWQVKTMPLSTSEVGIWLHTERALVLKPRET